MLNSKSLFLRRKQRVRNRLKTVSGGRLRLSVFRSSKHIYAQVIDDAKGETLVAASSIDKTLKDGLKTGADIAAAVAIHPDLITTRAAEKGAVKAKLLVSIGAPDPVAPKDHRDAFEKEMDAAGAKWQMLVFSGTYHAYTDQGSDVPGVAAWDEPACRQTYSLMHQFIADAFAGKL